MKKVLLLLISAAMLTNGCKKEEQDFTDRDDKIIRAYLTDNDLTAQKTEEGLYYIVTKDGAGPQPNIANKVTVHYKGYLLDGSVFDSSYDRGDKSTFSLGSVIKGWQIGIPKLSEGGAGRLFIPSHLAYGANPPSGRIPAHAVLAFDIELFEVR